MSTVSISETASSAMSKDRKEMKLILHMLKGEKQTIVLQLTTYVEKQKTDGIFTTYNIIISKGRKHAVLLQLTT